MSEHAFKRIGRDIREGRIGSLVLLYGKEQYLVNWAEELLVSTYINPATKQMDYAVFDASAAEPVEIRNACETIAMLSEKRVVTVRFGSKPKLKPTDVIKEAGELPPETLLILAFESEEIDKETLKAAEGRASVYDFASLDDRLLKAFIGKRVRAEGKTIGNGAAREFIEVSGYFHRDSDYTLYNLENDLKKIAAHCTGEEITADDINAVTNGSIERNIFALVDAVSKNRKDEAYRMLYNLLSGGDTVYHMLSMIIGQFEIILSVKELREKSMSNSQIHKALKIHEYRIKKAVPLADRYSIKDLRRILINAYEIDNSIKSGLMEAQLALELFIAEI